MDSDIDTSITAISVSYPFIATVSNGSSLQVFLVVEQNVLHDISVPIAVLLGLIACYFTFNMKYPKPLNSVLIFIQHFLLCIKDKQTIPRNVVNLVSSLDKL